MKTSTLVLALGAWTALLIAARPVPPAPVVGVVDVVRIRNESTTIQKAIDDASAEFAKLQTGYKKTEAEHKTAVDQYEAQKSVIEALRYE